MVDKAAIEAKHERTETCKKGHIRKGKKCLDNTPVRYGRASLKIVTAGTYKLRIKPSGKALTALKQGKTLTVRATVVFTPAGTTDHISKTTTVRVDLKKATSKRDR